MKTEISEVHHKGKKVGTVEVPIYETLDELLAHESEERILAMFNKQNKVRLQGNERTKHAEGRLGKEKQRMLAFKLLTTDELVRLAGDADAFKNYLDSPEMAERVRQAIESGELQA